MNLQPYRRWLVALLVTSLLGLLAYETAGIADPAVGDTISEHVWAWMDSSDLFTALIGVVFGHFVWQRKRPRCALSLHECPYQ